MCVNSCVFFHFSCKTLQRGHSLNSRLGFLLPGPPKRKLRFFFYFSQLKQKIRDHMRKVRGALGRYPWFSDFSRFFFSLNRRLDLRDHAEAIFFESKYVFGLWKPVKNVFSQITPGRASQPSKTKPTCPAKHDFMKGIL